ncbi:MAG: glycosyltransferase family 4 protein [Planctomycetota bacterium]
MTAQLRLLHVDSEHGFSGGEAQVLGLVEGLLARGHSVTVAGPSGGALAERGLALGWDWRHWGVGGDADVLAARRLARIMREEGVQLVHLHTGRAAWIGGWAARRAGVPAVVTRRQDKPLRGWKHRTTYAELVAAAVGISPAVTRQLEAVGAHATTIWSSVDPERLAPSAPRRELRRELGLEEGTFAVAVLAALVPRKGLHVLLDALGRLTTARSVRVLIAGEGTERARLETLARTLPAQRSARILGHVERKGDLLEAVDAFCLPSLAEGLGVAALEALAVGLPVVATSAGGLGEAIGDAGLVVPPGDARALARELDRLAADPALGRELGQRALRRIDAEFRFEQQVERYEALYHSVLAGSPRLAIARG